jgi:hypothetical protein
LYPVDITLSWRLRPLGHLSVESNEFDEANSQVSESVVEINERVSDGDADGTM